MSSLPALLDLETEAARFAAAARSPATLRTYRSDWRDFQRWCDDHRLTSLPAAPATVGLYLTDRARGLKVATLEHRLVTISQAHREANQPLDRGHPAIRTVFAGIRRSLGTRQTPKQALVTAKLRATLKALPKGGLVGVRDRAVLLVWFAAALRRSELAALDAGDLTFTESGIALTIRRSKTDQDGRGHVIGIGRGKRDCPVEAVRHWLDLSGVTEGRLFRAINRHGGLGHRISGDGLAQIVKRAVARAGFDPALFGGHSLRSGFCTSASEGGAELAQIARHARHKSVQTTQRYVHDAQLFTNPAPKAAGL